MSDKICLKDRSLWVYDLETLASAFTYSAINVDTEEIVQFVIHNDRFELEELIQHLKQCKGGIGFNNVNFDYPIIHLIIQKATFWQSQLNYYGVISIQDIIDDIYEKAQEIIESQNQDNFVKIVAIKRKDVLIQQLDLFKLWHFNNKARATSLKSLEISMCFPNVMEMPIDHTRDDITEDEIEGILKYNLNDVLATFKFYKLSEAKINLRKDLINKYNLPCINYPDSKIGEELVLKLFSETTGQDPWEIKEQRTYRPNIKIKDCIFDYIKFQSEEFNSLLDNLKNREVTNTKGAIANSVIYKGFKYDFGTGGIHGCIKPGVYESDDNYIIIDADVASLYPSIAVQNKLFPAHLGPKFCEVYEDILNQRIVAKKAGNMTLSDGFKLSLNSVYGKSNDIHSFLYDPLYTLKTTINGQLMLAMLAESLVSTFGTKIQVLQINTDGITIKIPREFVNSYYALCKLWEAETNLSLEYVDYSKMIIRDVNSYIAISTKGKVKYKGAFEIEKELHKDNSFKVVPLAVSNYFVNGIPVEETVKNHRNIYDFCGRQKFSKDSYGETHHLDVDKEVVEKQQKNVRYYISTPGYTFIKQYKKGTSEIINKGFEVTVFNDFVEKEWSDYNINYNFYIMECKKILEVIETKQMTLF